MLKTITLSFCVILLLYSCTKQNNTTPTDTTNTDTTRTDTTNTDTTRTDTANTDTTKTDTTIDNINLPSVNNTGLPFAKYVPTKENRQVKGLVVFPLIRLQYSDDDAESQWESKEDLEKCYNSVNGSKGINIGGKTYKGSIHDYYYFFSNGTAGNKAVVVDVILPRSSQEYLDKKNAEEDDLAKKLLFKDIVDYLNKEKGKTWWNQFTRTSPNEVDAVDYTKKNNIIGIVITQKRKKDPSGKWLDHPRTIFGATASALNEHRIQVSSDDQGNPIYLNDYTIGSIGLGVELHEWTHVYLNCPDYYGKINGSFAENGTGNWGIMSTEKYNDFNPEPLNALLRVNAGWANVKDLSADGTYNITGNTDIASSDNNQIYRIKNPKNPHEYLLIENFNESYWNKSHWHNNNTSKQRPDFGLLIWHADVSPGNNDATKINLDPSHPGNVQVFFNAQSRENHYELALIQADGREDIGNQINGADLTDVFGANIVGGSDNYDSKDKTWWWGSNQWGPNAVYANGDKMNIQISNISTPRNTMTFTFKNP